MNTKSELPIEMTLISYISASSMASVASILLLTASTSLPVASSTSLLSTTAFSRLCWKKEICNVHSGVFRNKSRGGLKFFLSMGVGADSACAGAQKPLENRRFHLKYNILWYFFWSCANKNKQCFVFCTVIYDILWTSIFNENREIDFLTKNEN